MVFSQQSLKFLLVFVVSVSSAAEAEQSPTSFADTIAKCTPAEVHIAYGDFTSEMVIIWSTEALCSPASVQYSLNDIFKLDQAAPGDSRLFTGPNGEESHLHKVKIRGLQPDSTYFYKPSTNGVTAGPYFFRTAGVAGSENINFLVMSDLGVNSPAIPTIIEEATSGKYAALLHAGNIAKNLSSQNGEVGDTYFQLMEPALRTAPYMVSPGPDEDEAGTYLYYTQRFAMPFGEWPISKDRMWYSVDIGSVHLISYSTEIFYTDGGQYRTLQHDWLIRDMKQANERRDKVPWVVAFAHRPMYCSYENPSFDCNKKASENGRKIEDVLYSYGADIIIQSYGAAYERSYPQFKGVAVNENYTDPLGPVHIMTGGLSPWEMQYNFTETKPKWCAFRYTNESVMSYGRLHILNSSHAHYEQVAVETKQVIDSFTIVQNKHGQFSIEDLSANITANIDKSIKDAGGKPGVLNVDEIGDQNGEESRIKKLLQGDNRNRLVIGIVGGSVVLVALIAILSIRRCRKRRRTTRRWEQMDINYGKKFYSKAPDKDEDNDFEIDMSDGTEGTRQLLNSED